MVLGVVGMGAARETTKLTVIFGSVAPPLEAKNINSLLCGAGGGWDGRRKENNKTHYPVN